MELEVLIKTILIAGIIFNSVFLMTCIVLLFLGQELKPMLKIYVRLLAVLIGGGVLIYFLSPLLLYIQNF